jgi:PIN domain nuclease of toxin-antitoxin system
MKKLKIGVVFTEKQEKLYRKFGVDPEVVLSWLNREVVKLLETSENIYGILNDLDENLVLAALWESKELKRKGRLEQKEINRYEDKERERRKERMGKIKERHLENVGL